MKRTKLYKLIIAALVVLNAGMLIFFFLARPPHPGPPQTGDLAEKLELVGEAKVKITALEKEHHQLKRALMKTDRELHDELFANIGSDRDVTALQERIAENFVKTEKMTYDFFNEVAKECSKEQKEELRKMIYHAFRQMKGPKEERK